MKRFRILVARAGGFSQESDGSIADRDLPHELVIPMVTFVPSGSGFCDMRECTFHTMAPLAFGSPKTSRVPSRTLGTLDPLQRARTKGRR